MTNNKQYPNSRLQKIPLISFKKGENSFGLGREVFFDLRSGQMLFFTDSRIDLID